jgi:hypothetical protein
MILGLRLRHGVDFAMTFSAYTTGLFSTSENRDSEKIQWALHEPGIIQGLRIRCARILKNATLLTTSRCGIKKSNAT